MKKSELKKILKPLINECIKEAMLEGGVLSGIITEVARGMGDAVTGAPRPEAVIEDPAKDRMKRNAFSQVQKAQLKEHKAKLMAAVGGDSFNNINLFEGTSPGPAPLSPRQQANPLGAQDPADAGVDISNLFGSVGTQWNAHMNVLKEEK